VPENQRSQRFADALKSLEQGDSDDMLAQYADDAELQRPERKHGPGREAAPQTFWKQYLAEFDEISTEFTRIAEAGDEGVLEWRSTGRLSAGRDIDYQGVSLLTFDGDRVSRFATYYDTAAFIDPIE
jgi:ketosteroid isomerase-like protein